MSHDLWRLDEGPVEVTAPMMKLAALLVVLFPGKFGQRGGPASLVGLGADDACSRHVHLEELDLLESGRPQEPGPFGGFREPPFLNLRSLSLFRYGTSSVRIM